MRIPGRTPTDFTVSAFHGSSRMRWSVVSGTPLQFFQGHPLLAVTVLVPRPVHDVAKRVDPHTRNDADLGMPFPRGTELGAHPLQNLGKLTTFSIHHRHRRRFFLQRIVGIELLGK